MLRDVARLAGEQFDVAVVGGGVYALSVAAELAARDLRVAILERGDFAAATSFNSLKTIHGGIRALQHGAIDEMREFVRERRAFARRAPHLVRPLPFVVPTYRHPIRNRAVMAAFLALYDRLSADRNAGVDPSRHLPASRTMGRAECLGLNPAIDPIGVTGGAIWHDYQLHAPERFAMALLHSARGAAAANYAPVTAIQLREGTVAGVRALDLLSNTPFEVRARVVVNAAGPWAWAVLQSSGIRTAVGPPAFSLAMNVVVDRAPLTHAVGGLAQGRFLFMVPWRDRSIVGTSHDRHDGPAAGLGVPGEHLRAFLENAAVAFPRADLGRAAIRLVHRGLLPAAGTGRADALLKRSIVHDHGNEGAHGLLTVVGVRYTTAGATARAAAARVWRLLGRGGAPPERAPASLFGADVTSLQEYERAEAARWPLPAHGIHRLIAAYGAQYAAVARIAAGEPQLAEPLGPGCDITGAEILHAVREEMAVHLDDALLRRTAAGAGGHPGAETVACAAAIMARALSWTPARTSDEIDALNAAYAFG